MGGHGTDVALYSGARADYTVTLRDDGRVIVGHLDGSGYDGTDTLWFIDILRFADGDVLL